MAVIVCTPAAPFATTPVAEHEGTAEDVIRQPELLAQHIPAAPKL
jgi:hypothetical protein